ncbi:PREDICTED: microtubule-associated protein 10 [Condylura cristata]|uniref:microtubule-associated protein 10 n=1 Tax=Condylura cristata TaxID=143302 RepID=UPI0003347486|nr:PREDICTED: microtubule-associated protein 10 [Condylura cristata]
MAAVWSERLFSLELLVDWVRLEAGLLPQRVVSVDEEEEGSAPRWSSSLCPAVAFRLLDFPTLLVYPPGGPASPAPEPRPGVLNFGRGKSCLFRLHPATLHRLLLRTPLYTLLLQLPPGDPTPTPQLLGSSTISLAAAVNRVLGPARSGCSQGHRGSFPLHNQRGEHIGDIALGYRLTDLGNSLLGHLERPLRSTVGGLEAVELQKAVAASSQTQQEKQQLPQPTTEPRPIDADRSLVGLKIPKAQKNLKEIVCCCKVNPDNASSVESVKTNSVGSDARNVRSVSPSDEGIAELDLESNIFCPPPLYYTHLTQETIPPVPGKITIKPQMNEPEEMDGIFLGEKPAHTNPPNHVNSIPPKSPPKVINPPHIQDMGASNQATSHSQTEQNRINMISQLPLLNALLVELSLLYNQPVARPTHIHPHLAWLYRTEDKKSSESSAKSTFKSESKKDKLSAGENEKSALLQYPKYQVESLKKDKCFEKNSGTPPKRAPRGKLLYGLTNTLKLRLKQTNPDLLAVHEKREQYRKMQAQMMGPKLRMHSSKVKVFSFAKQHEKPHQLSKDKHLESDVSFAENSDTSKQMNGIFDNPTITKETNLNCATEKVVGCGENIINNGSLEEMISHAHFIDPERFSHVNILERKVEMQDQRPCVFQQVVLVDSNSTVVDKEIGDKQVQTTDKDILTADVNENKPSKNSSSESISELKYSDDFASTCYSEDFYTTEDTSRILHTRDSSPGAENPKHGQHISKSSETRLSVNKSSSEKSSILSPPFSAGSPIHSHKRSHNAKTQDKSLKETSSNSSSDVSSSFLTEEKESQIEHKRMHVSEVTKKGQSISAKTSTSHKSLEKSQSPRTSQVSSYLPSNLSELEFNVLNSSMSEHFEEEGDEVGSLSISKQCKDICELVINKLPGYTM